MIYFLDHPVLTAARKLKMKRQSEKTMHVILDFPPAAYLPKPAPSRTKYDDEEETEPYSPSTIAWGAVKGSVIFGSIALVVWLFAHGSICASNRDRISRTLRHRFHHYMINWIYMLDTCPWGFSQMICCIW